MMDDLFHVTVYDKSRQRVGWCNAPISQMWTPRHNQQGTGNLVVPGDVDAAALLSLEGARVVVQYQDEHLMSGPVRLIEGRGPRAERELTFQVQDDFRLLSRILGWPVPTAAISGQGAAEYRVLSGPAETVAKTLIRENANRVNAPVDIAPDQGRGGNVRLQIRMQPIADILLPLVDQAGVGITVRQVGGRFLVDCYEPQAWPLTLSEASGTIADLEFSRTPPSMTRVVVGGPGEGVERIFRQRINAEAEALYGDVIEGFVDARDVKDDDPDRLALMDARGDEALAEAAAKVGLSLTLSETDVFRYGGPLGVHVGDALTIELSPGVVITDVLRAATLGLSANGPVATPQVGERTDDPMKALVQAVGRTARDVRAMKAGT